MHSCSTVVLEWRALTNNHRGCYLLANIKFSNSFLQEKHLRDELRQALHDLDSERDAIERLELHGGTDEMRQKMDAIQSAYRVSINCMIVSFCVVSSLACLPPG